MDTLDVFGKPRQRSVLGGLFKAPAETRAHKSLKSHARLVEKLVLLVQAGDTEAFAKLYELFVTPLYRYVYYRVYADDVEDLLEIVFLKIWRNINQYTPGKNSFSAWAYRITHNVVIDYYRRAGDNQTAELHENIPDGKRDNHSQTMISQTLSKQVLNNAIRNLKSTYQNILVLKYLNDLTNEELETILMKSQNAIRILSFRALRALRKELEKQGITGWET